jgi:hypothetical protein
MHGNMNVKHENVTRNEPIKKRTIDKYSMMIKFGPQRNYRYQPPSPSNTLSSFHNNVISFTITPSQDT